MVKMSEALQMCWRCAYLELVIIERSSLPLLKVTLGPGPDTRRPDTVHT